VERFLALQVKGLGKIVQKISMSEAGRKEATPHVADE